MRHAENKVIEPHVKQVVVGIEKPNQPEDYIFLCDAVEKIEEGEWQETDAEGQHYLFTNKWSGKMYSSNASSACDVQFGKRVAFSL